MASCTLLWLLPTSHASVYVTCLSCFNRVVVFQHFVASSKTIYGLVTAVCSLANVFVFSELLLEVFSVFSSAEECGVIQFMERIELG